MSEALKNEVLKLRLKLKESEIELTGLREEKAKKNSNKVCILEARMDENGEKHIFFKGVLDSDYPVEGLARNAEKIECSVGQIYDKKSFRVVSDQHEQIKIEGTKRETAIKEKELAEAKLEESKANTEGMVKQIQVITKKLYESDEKLKEATSVSQKAQQEADQSEISLKQVEADLKNAENEKINLKNIFDEAQKSYQSDRDNLAQEQINKIHQFWDRLEKTGSITLIDGKTENLAEKFIQGML